MSLLTMARVRVVATCLPAIVASATLLVLVKTDVFAARRSQRARDAAAQPTSGLNRHPDANPVIVELFTSEGCSSCPPADALLARLQQDQPVVSADIITLEEHVDYWDHLGWRDRFSSPYITQRQRDYQSVFHLGDVFTPQFVVNGSAQFDGTDPSAIESAIEKAAVSTIWLQLTSVRVRLSSPVDIRAMVTDAPATHTEYVRPYAAVVEPWATTDVHAGENDGRTLRHIHAVRSIEMHGDSWHMKDLGRAPFSIQLPAKTNPVDMRLVVFVQAKPYGPILGAAVCTITRNNIEGNDAFHGSQGNDLPSPYHTQDAPNPQPPDACPPPQPSAR